MLNEVRRKPEKPIMGYRGGRWFCHNYGFVSWGDTKKEAYQSWKQNQPRPIGHN